jgi:hypothetical protein
VPGLSGVPTRPAKDNTNPVGRHQLCNRKAAAPLNLLLNHSCGSGPTELSESGGAHSSESNRLYAAPDF